MTRLALLALALAAGLTAANVWVDSFLRAARKICRVRATPDPQSSPAETFLYGLFPPRADGWEEKIEALTVSEIWPHVGSVLWSSDTALWLTVPFVALVPACLTPLVSADRRVRWVALWAPFVIAGLLIPFTLTGISPAEACSLFPSLGHAVLSVLALIGIFALPLLTFVVLVLYRWWRRRLPPGNGTD